MEFDVKVDPAANVNPFEDTTVPSNKNTPFVEAGNTNDQTCGLVSLTVDVYAVGPLSTPNTSGLNNSRKNIAGPGAKPSDTKKELLTFTVVDAIIKTLIGTLVMFGRFINAVLPGKITAVLEFIVPYVGRLPTVDCVAFNPFPDLSFH